MNIQIFGVKKCKNSRAAERFFKERNINFHFVDLNERTMSKGEFDKITAKIKAEDLIDTNSSYFKKNGYEHRMFDIGEELFEHQELFLTPIVRNGNSVSAGFAPEIWKTWL